MSISGTEARAAKPRVPFDALALIGVLVLAIAVVLFFAGGRSQHIRFAQSGFDGLALWLADGGIDAQAFAGGWTIPAGEVGLNIVPLFDAALGEDRVSPTTQQELLLQRDEYDLKAEVLREKILMTPTLLVLPKWRSGVRLTGLAHPILLIDRREVSGLLNDLVPGSVQARVTHIPRVFNDFDYTTSEGRALTAQLYVAQTFQGRGCEPIIGQQNGIILGLCPASLGNETKQVYILSDPDLLNNHGLRLGDNAWIARELIADLAGEQRVIIDYSRENWLVQEYAYDHPDRTWADLARFFSYPFTILWVAAALVLALFLWRGGIRFGPVNDVSRELAASKSVMIGARARLMRLTGQDGALVGAFARARIAAVSQRVLGPGEASRGENGLLRFARRRNPKLAAKIEETLTRMSGLPAHMTPEAAIEQVDELEHLLEQLSDDT